MPKGYHQLNLHQRIQISILLQRGISQRLIALEMGVAPSTINRELSRNLRPEGFYEFEYAHTIAKQRRSEASSRPSKLTGDIKEYIYSLLRTVQASPEQISGRMKLDGLKAVSYTTIYRLIHQDRHQGGSLFRYLRRKCKRYNRRPNPLAGRGCISNRKDIDERPSIVEKKKRLGDIELDTIIGAQRKGAIVSMVDRASKFTKLTLLDRPKAKQVTNAIVNSCISMPFNAKTFTADNGKEFSDHQTITKYTKANVYFAKPYHSWERGLNEHTNGLVRQYLPKGTNFLNLTHQHVQNIENILNNRPRKILNYKTPNEVVGIT